VVVLLKVINSLKQTINMHADFFFWWSIISTILSFILVCFSVWQYWASRSQEQKIRAQVKVWMQDANGVSLALQRIIADNLTRRFSSTNDVCNAVFAVQASASALYQGLYEERCVTEEEYKERQKKIMDKLDKQQEAQENATSAVKA
jgi:hypothetical protein